MSKNVVIVGTGVAGLTAALALAGRAHVRVLTKAAAGDSNTAHAQGGIAAVTTAEDSVASHVADTLNAGANWCDAEAVQVLCSEGPDRIREMIEAGVAFDTDDGGALAQGLEAAHSFARVLHAGGDATGRAISQGLLQAARRASIEILEHTAVTELVCEEGSGAGTDCGASGCGRITGVRTLDLSTGETEEIPADAVILATGGAGQLFPATSNPAVATGDGVALAARAGAALADLEFYQFHPTTLATGSNFLISEAVRGEGATLIDTNGHRFMPAIDPRAELAPRDVVARAVAAHLDSNGRGVYLDARGLNAPGLNARGLNAQGLNTRGSSAGDSDTSAPGSDFLATRFPGIDAAVRQAGFDWSREPIPVTPAAHYWMGGIATDLDGRTSIDSLFAVGECACTGVHGANRLASNSLLEGAVFGYRAAQAILGDQAVVKAAARSEPAASHRAALRRPELRYARDLAPSSATQVLTRAELQQLMWDCAGLARDTQNLTHARQVLASCAVIGETTPLERIENENLLLLARLIVESALARETSLGAHYRSDQPAHPRPAAAAAPAGVTEPDLALEAH